MEATIKIKTIELRCVIENDLFRLSQDLRKQYISILESYEPVFITDESAVQHELDHHDRLAEAVLNSCKEADIISELAYTSSTEWKVRALR